jgi:hypothetical protein
MSVHLRPAHGPTPPNQISGRDPCLKLDRSLQKILDPRLLKTTHMGICFIKTRKLTFLVELENGHYD